MGVPLAEKTKLEVFGKGSGKEPFSRKVFPSSRYKLLYEYRRYAGFLLEFVWKIHNVVPVHFIDLHSFDLRDIVLGHEHVQRVHIRIAAFKL